MGAVRCSLAALCLRYEVTAGLVLTKFTGLSEELWALYPEALLNAIQISIEGSICLLDAAEDWVAGRHPNVVRLRHCCQLGKLHSGISSIVPQA